MKVYSFEKLDAWKEGRSLAVWIYKGTKDFSVEERHGLTGQLRRSAISVVCNIAEGSASLTPKSQSFLYEMAYGSLIELLNQLILSNDLIFLSDEALLEGRSKVDSISGKISALKNASLNRKPFTGFI